VNDTVRPVVRTAFSGIQLRLYLDFSDNRADLNTEDANCDPSLPLTFHSPYALNAEATQLIIERTTIVCHALTVRRAFLYMAK
jgi:hypothetical protein